MAAFFKQFAFPKINNPFLALERATHILLDALKNPI
jgi:hypothetical protein